VEIWKGGHIVLFREGPNESIETDGTIDSLRTELLEAFAAVSDPSENTKE
jgi:hypothetical protein